MYRLLLILIFFSSGLNAQNEISNNGLIENDSTIEKSNQKSLIFSFNLLNPRITESSTIGKASDAKLGFNIGFTIFLYKHLYIAGFTGTSYLDIKDQSLVGNYLRTTITQSYLQVGYEFPLNSKFRLGINYTPFGNARYKNVVASSDVKQIDRASINMYGTSLSYNVSTSTAIFLNYNYRVDKTEIVAPSRLNEEFSRIHYHTIGIGVKLYIGDEDLISKFIN